MRAGLLGKSTVANVIKAYGQPVDGAAITEIDGAPFFYLLRYAYGAEGSFRIEYSASGAAAGHGPWLLGVGFRADERPRNPGRGPGP